MIYFPKHLSSPMSRARMNLWKMIFQVFRTPSPDPVEGALPPLPGDPVPVVEEPSELPSSEPALDLPLLPGMEDEGGLPPLPETDDGLGDLPPLPPLP